MSVMKCLATFRLLITLPTRIPVWSGPFSRPAATDLRIFGVLNLWLYFQSLCVRLRCVAGVAVRAPVALIAREYRHRPRQQAVRRTACFAQIPSAICP
jgi:hypothetical protein